MAGSDFGLIVGADNVLGLDTSFNGGVTVSLIDFSGTNSTLGGTLTLTAVNGVATFSGLTVSQPGTYALTVTSNATAATATNLFDVIAAPATQLVVTTEPPSAVTAGAGFEVNVTAEDASGNVDPNFSGSVTLGLDMNPASGTLAGTLTAAAVNGVAIFTGLTIDNAGSGYTLQASATGLTSATTSAVDVTRPGVATQFVVTSQPPSSIDAGTGFGFVVSAEDGFGTVDTSFSGTVTVDDIFGNQLAQTTAVNGVATFTGLTLNQVGSYSLTVNSSNGLTATTNSVNVMPAAATQLQIEGPYSNVLSGVPFSLTTYAVDPFGNVDSTFNGSVTLSLSMNPGGSLGGTLTATAVDGVATFSNLTINDPGSGYVIQAASSGLTAGTTLSIDVTIDELVVTTQPPSQVIAGGGFGLIVAAENGSGSVDTSFDGTVTLTLTDVSGNADDLAGTTTVTAVNGVATFSSLEADEASYYTISANSNGLAQTVTNVFSVIAAPATQLVVTTEPPSTVTAGAGFEVDVTAEDANGNVDTSFNGTVTIALDNNAASGTLGGTLTATAVNGVAAFTGLSIDNSGSGYTLRATSNSLTSATTSAINVTPPGVATQLVVTTQPPSSVSAGASFGLVVKTEDGFGNVDSTFNGTVTVTNPADGTVLGQTTAINGLATFSGLTLDQAGDGNVLSVTSNTLAVTTDSFTVNPLEATELEVGGPLSNVLPGSPFDLDVLAVDPYDNVEPTFNGSVTLALDNNPGGVTLGGTLTATAVDGLAVFSGLTINNPGSGYTLEATGPGLTAGVSLPFDVTNDQLVVTTQPPSTLTAGSSFGFVVSAEDSAGNVDTSFNGSMTASLIDFGSSTPTLGETVTVTAVNGVATFSGLTVDQSGTYALSLTSNGLGGTVTNPFSLNSGTSRPSRSARRPPRWSTARRLPSRPR